MRFRKFFLVKALLIIPAIAVLGWLVSSLWNWVMPTLFTGANHIDFLHALGLLVLCRVLFGGFRGKGRWRERERRWQEMTPEERKQFQRCRWPSRRKSSEDAA